MFQRIQLIDHPLGGFAAFAHGHGTVQPGVARVTRFKLRLHLEQGVAKLA